MCRITGIIDFNKTATTSNKQVIDSMRDTMTAGGPDDCGSFVYNIETCKIALGHRRLSIIDVSSNGHQPMLSGDDNIVIVFNGEIYNYEEIRDELIGFGIQFKTHSDTEVVIQAYIKWGISSLEKFIGMFAFLLLDKKANMMYAVRDRVGVTAIVWLHICNISVKDIAGCGCQ